PPYAAVVLFVAYALIMSWAVLMFRFRRGDQIYITQWYLLGEFLWFPWLYAAAQAMLFVVPVQGVMQAAVGWWYANNLLFLWLGAIALGTAYYMIPKVIGRPLYSYHLATIGFWTYALFSSWTGMQRLVDGPFPAWMITASIAATILTIIPVATVGLNHHMTMQGYFPVMRYSPTLRFTVFGAMSYTVFSVVGILISLRSTARYLHFTEASIAYSHMGLYAFFTMIMFGSMYYIVPRLVGREWRYATLIKGLVPLFIGLFGTFAFSWLGLTVIPNWQIGALNPQTDEEGTDAYPTPKSGMADRGRQIYAANGCIYCHSQQIRPDYDSADIDRVRDAGPSPGPKWAERRSAPRDYIFDRPVVLGQERMGPDVANIGKAAPTEEEKPAAAPAANVAATSPAPAQSPRANVPPSKPGPPAPAASSAPAQPAPAQSPPPNASAPKPGTSGPPPAAPATSPAPPAGSPPAPPAAAA